MNPTVSIIVPVYNAEATISRCIESIINQEYRDFELLLIDDGSTDSSGTICDRYAAEDSRIRLIHKENTGVSETRNMALDLACGTYLQFLDSDDWITPNATRLFVEEAERYHCDMVISDFYRVVGKRVAHKGDIDDDCVLTQEEFSAHMLQNPADFYYGVLWNKLYRRDIVEKYHLRMNPEISWCEDFMFNLEYIRHAEVFYALQVPVYYYVKTKGSLASQGMSISKTIKMKLMVFEYYNNFYKHVLDEEDYEKSRLQVYRFLVDAAGDGAVPPSFFSGSKKLGEERNSVSQEVVAGEGILMDDYRDRKLLDYYLEPIAQKNNLTLGEVRLLLCLSQLRHIGTRKEIADFAGITVRSLSLLLQRLSLKNMLKYEENRTTKELKITFLPLASPIQNEIAAAQSNFEQAKYAGFTEDELIQYAALTEKIKNNIQKIL
ncbi:glycosyltransferase family 2 protein [Fusicatenibacter saccharivorans]|uniref:glycosyltransferase family 2 protein n=1 Tax=Fusicatenibacter saccharivorans TaxID=1150298 RepID=UPI002A790EAD|nr:glycosyltransferase [bacterium]MDD7142593.1 glycosyltransferase [bacterium]MDY2886988.1 glycosyltransferase [Bariatricus sp.]MDY5458048.1 glycosyltransferase [Bariatricus sp.]